MPDSRASSAESQSVYLHVQAIWQECLQVPDLAPEDDFFRTGGESFEAMQMLTRIREDFLVEIPLARLFAARTLGAFAVAVELALAEVQQDGMHT